MKMQATGCYPRVNSLDSVTVQLICPLKTLHLNPNMPKFLPGTNLDSEEQPRTAEERTSAKLGPNPSIIDDRSVKLEED